MTPRTIPVARAAAPSPSRLRATAAALALALVALLVPASPGWAHDVLLGSGPKADETVETVPEAVELTFNNEILAIGSEVVVADEDGVDRAEGDLTIDGTVVSQPLAADAPAGDYTVTWRVVSSDGHPISGTFEFTAREGAEPEAAPTSAEPTPTATEEPTDVAATTEPDAATETSAPTDAAATSAAPPTQETEPATTDEDEVDTGSPLAMVVGLAVLAVALSALGYWLLRRSRVRRDGDAG